MSERILNHRILLKDPIWYHLNGAFQSASVRNIKLVKQETRAFMASWLLLYYENKSGESWSKKKEREKEKWVTKVGEQMSWSNEKRII